MKKIAVDILMGVTIILEFVSLPILLHEILGIGLIFLVILHINFIEPLRPVEVGDSRAVSLL